MTAHTLQGKEIARLSAQLAERDQVNGELTIAGKQRVGVVLCLEREAGESEMLAVRLRLIGIV